MFQRLISFLKPNRIDVLLLTIAGLCIFGIATPVAYSLTINYGVELNRVLLITPFFAMWIAAAVSLGVESWKSVARLWPFILGSAFALGSIVWSAQLGGVWQPDSSKTGKLPLPIIVLALAGCFMAAFCCVKLTIWLHDKIIARWKASAQKVSRVKILVTVAILLYVLFLLNPSGNDSTRGTFRLGGTTATIAYVIATLFFAGIVPGLILHRVRSFSTAITATVTYFAVLGAVVALQVYTPHNFVLTQAVLLPAVYATIFCVVCLAWRICKPKLNHAPQASASPKAAKSRSVERPTCWGWTASLFTVLAFAFTYLFDPLILVSHPGSERWSVAKAVRSIQRSHGTQTIASSNWFQSPGGKSFIGLQTKFTKDSPANHFDPLVNWKGLKNLGGVALTLRNMEPHIRTSAIRDCQKFITVEEATLTPSQFADLVDNTKWHSSFRDIRAVEKQGEISPVRSVGQVHLFKMEAGGLASLLAVIPNSALVTSITIYDGNLNDADWQQVLRLAEVHPIALLNTAIDDRAVELIKASRATELSIQLHARFSDRKSFELTKKHWQLLLDSDVKLPRNSLSNDSITNPELWGAIFTCRGQGIVPVAWSDLFSNFAAVDIRVAASQFHWRYNDSPTIEKIFVPRIDDHLLKELSQLSHLKTVSFDHHWLPGLKSSVSYDMNTQWKNWSSLAQLKNLEQLYLPLGAFVHDFSFLKSMKQLQHLQVDSAFAAGVTPGTTQPFLAADCPALESLVMFSKPDLAMHKELLQIKTLKELIIVDFAGDFDNAADARKRFEKSFAGIKLRIVDSAAYQPDIPEDFQQHVERVREQVRRKYLAE